MKNNLLILTFLLGGLLLLSHCKKDKLIEINGIVSGKIIDAATSTGAQGVQISLLGLGLKDSSKADGTYTISGIPAGEYVVVFSKAGYAPAKDTISIATSGAASSNGSSGDYRVVNREIRIMPLTGKAKGRVYGEGDVPLASVAVTASVTGTDSVFTTTTDANGYFSYNSLPFAPNNNLTNASNTAKNGVTITVIHGAASGSGYDYYFETAAAKTLSYTILVNSAPITFLGGNYDNANNNSGFDPNVPNGIVLYFSENVNLGITSQKGNIQLSKSGSVIGIELTSDSNRLIITPKVKLEAGKTYSISGLVYASDYKFCVIPGGESFQTKAAALNALNTASAPVLTIDASKNIAVTSRNDVVMYEVYVSIPSINNGEFILTSTAPFSNTSTTDTNLQKDIKGWDGSLVSTSAYTAANTQFYVVPVGIDATGKTVRGTKSNIVTK